MNPITDGPEKEKPAKKKRVEVKPEPVAIIETPPKAPIRESNVMTREEWERHLKTIQE